MFPADIFFAEISVLNYFFGTPFAIGLFQDLDWRENAPDLHYKKVVLNQKTARKFIQKGDGKMQTNIVSTKISDMVSNAINTLMVAVGTVSIISLLAFLIAALF